MENDYIMVEVEPNKYKKIKSPQIGKGLIEILNKTEEKFEMKKGERGQTNMKVYKVKVTLADSKEKIEIVSAEDELSAIDLVMEHYDSKNVLDIKVI